MFKSEKIVPIGVIVGIGAAASAALAACYVLSKREEEQFHLNTKLDTSNQVNSSLKPHNKVTILYKTIPKECTGAVIGRGGENIRLIQRQTNTRITFSNDFVTDEDEDRTVAIKGTHSGALAAAELIESVIDKTISNYVQRVFIPVSEVGIIIGKSGATIRTISEESGAKVNIPRPKNPDQKTIGVEIRGERSNVETATKMINEKLKLSRNMRSQSSNDSPLQPLQNGQNGHAYPKSFTPSHCNIASIPLDKFERLELDLETGYQDVYVACVQNPSRFWVQMCGTMSADLDRLMMDMTDFYENGENLLNAQVKHCKVGDIVAAPMKNEEHWYRAKIIAYDDSCSRPGEAEVTVYYLDFGDESVLLENQIYLLHEEFLTRLTFQAIECSLFGVEPVSSDDDHPEWSKEAIDCFKKATRTSLWEKVFVKTQRITKSTSVPQEHYAIDIYALHESNDLSIADYLVEKGHAQPLKEC